MYSIDQLFSNFENRNILIVGDVMIDRYLWGNVDRISPEAPVPIIHLQETDNRLGGAANVALNIKALGATPFLFSLVGKDGDAQYFSQLLPQHEISEAGIIQSPKRITTVKTRVISNAQHLIRIDQEQIQPLTSNEVANLCTAIVETLDTENIDLILFQDYNKGVLSFEMINKVILEAIKRDIPTIVDPKFDHFFTYKKTTLFKPNLKEVNQKLPFKVGANLNDLRKAANYIEQQLNNQQTMITLSEKGVFLQTKSGISEIIPTQSRQIADVCGAGDTVIAVAALGIAAQLPPREMAMLANLAGGQVCEKVGVVPIDRKQLREEYLDLLARGSEASQ